MSENIAGKVTDSEDNVSLYVDKDLVQTSDSDKGRQKLVNSSILNSDCHIAHLSGFSEHLQDSKDETEKNLEAEKKVILICFYSVHFVHCGTKSALKHINMHTQCFTFAPFAK